MARRDAHKLRAASSAILTGVGTVLRDDPQMTARLDDDTQRQPLRVILDSHLSTPPQAKILKPPGNALIITADNDNDAELLRGEIIVCGNGDGGINLREVMRELADREVNDLMVEAGARLSGSLLAAKLVDEIVIYMAPDIFGDNARGMFAISDLNEMADKHHFIFRDVKKFGDDLRLTLAAAE